MRILLDTTYSRRAPFSGTAVYLDQLGTALRSLDGIELLGVANPRRRAPAGGGPGSVRNLLADQRWTHTELPRLARAERADVIHHPLPARSRGTQVAQVVTLMDLAYEHLPDCFDTRFRIYARLAYRRAALAADAVVCISETTARDARELWGVDPSRIVVAPLGPGQALETPVVPRTHFLYVGDDEPRKSLSTLLEAYRLYRQSADEPLPLVLAGSASASGPGIQTHNQLDSVQLAGQYASAVALVHPSLYEGFGLTLLEAMAAGTPVIAARSPGVTEVCADAALYAAPRATASFAEAMARVAAETGLSRELADRGRRRAELFSWADCARAHAEAYSLARNRG